MAFFSADDNALTRLVRERLGLDFRYREEELRRRVGARMTSAHCDTFAEYAAYLGANDDRATIELTRLDAVLSRARTRSASPSAEIDRALDHLRDVVPGIAERGLRVLAAGCGDGTECGVLLAQVRTHRGFRGTPVRLLGIDVSDDALLAARAAGHACDFRRANIRALAEYADAGPFDLILCRNVLVYFDREAQEATCFAFTTLLADHGLLLIGESDASVTAGAHFAPLTDEPRILYQHTFRARPFYGSP